MPNIEDSPIGRVRPKTDSVGILVALLALPFLHFIPGTLSLQASAKWHMAWLLACSAVAGAACALSRIGDLGTPILAVGNGLRQGLRAGLRAALTAGALVTFGSTLSALGAANAAAEAQLKGEMRLTLFVSLAAILPGVLAGAIGGAWAAHAVRAKIPGTNRAEPKLLPWWQWVSLSLTAVSLLIFVSPAVFLVRSPKVDPPPPSPAAAPQSQPKPPFHYSPPEGIARASFGDFGVAFTKSIEGVEQGAAMSLSANGDRFAFCARTDGGNGVTVYDLDWLKPVASFALPSHPKNCLAWSPDEKRLACICEGPRRGITLFILDLATSAAIELPQPKGGNLPQGDLLWIAPDQLAFFPADEEALVLNLETLVLKALKDSTVFAKADQADRKRWLDGPRTSLPVSANWRFGTVSALRGLETPSRKEPAKDLQAYSQAYCAFRSPKLELHRPLPELPVSVGTKVFCSPDGSKIVRIADGQAQVSFMKLVQEEPRIVEIDMSLSRQDIEGEQAGAEIEAKRLCAIAFEPLTNPLNGKVVGPDYAKAVASLRLLSWNGTKASFVVLSSVSPITADSVIGALHLRGKGAARRWEHAGEVEWWARPAALQPLAPDAESSLARLEPIEEEDGLELEADGTAFIVAVAKRPAAPAPPAAVIPKPEAGESDVRAFLEKHHGKASRGDIDGMVSDYAETVNFLDKGLIPRSRIAEEELVHRQKWSSSEEVIEGSISVIREGRIWKASYLLSFRNANANAWQRGSVPLHVEVASTSAGFQIEGQKAGKADLQQGSTAPSPNVASQVPVKASPPPVKIRLQAPVWIGNTSIQALGSLVLSVHQAVHISNGRVKIHRTYRTLVGSSTPADIARQFPSGLVAMQTAEIEGTVENAESNSFDIYCGVQGWVQDADASVGEWNSMAASDAKKFVGTYIHCTQNGEDLLVNGVRLTPANKLR